MVAQSPCPGAGAPEFHLRDGALFCEDVALEALAQQFGTPLYVYSAGVVRARARRVRAAFGDDAVVCHAVKANSNLTLLRLLDELGIPVRSRHCGGDKGRRMMLDSHTGIVTIEIVGADPVEI